MKYLTLTLFCAMALAKGATAQTSAIYDSRQTTTIRGAPFFAGATAQTGATYDSRQTMTMTLRGAPFFAMGGVGYGAQRSFGERALRDLARFEDAAFGFEAILDNRSTSRAGQLYALIGLRWTNDREFHERIAPFLRDQTPVEVRGGCFVFKLPVSYIAGDIERGEYQQPLVLNYVVPSIAAEARWHRARLFSPFELKTGLRSAPLTAPSQRL